MPSLDLWILSFLPSHLQLGEELWFTVGGQHIPFGASPQASCFLLFHERKMFISYLNVSGCLIFLFISLLVKILLYKMPCVVIVISNVLLFSMCVYNIFILLFFPNPILYQRWSDYLLVDVFVGCLDGVRSSLWNPPKAG